jgi:hypothetical protein
MKKKSIATFGLLALLGAAPAFGQQISRVDIPFEFRVGATVMPAGQYTVAGSFGTNRMLFLRCYECGPRTVTALPHSIGGYHNQPTEGRLVFHKYGETYFLSQVWSSQGGPGDGLTESKSEREISRRASLTQTSVVLLARR